MRTRLKSGSLPEYLCRIDFFYDCFIVEIVGDIFFPHQHVYCCIFSSFRHYYDCKLQWGNKVIETTEEFLGVFQKSGTKEPWFQFIFP